MKVITTWFCTGGGSGGDVRVEGEYRGLTSLSLNSRPGPSSYKRTIMSVPYHMKQFNKFITTIRLTTFLSTVYHDLSLVEFCFNICYFKVVFIKNYL